MKPNCISSDILNLSEPIEGIAKRTESSDRLSVLDQLNPNTFPNSGVGLLCLNTDLLENYALGVRGASEWRGLESGSESTLLI